MKYNFQLPEFPGAQFEMESSIWTGKSKLFKDGIIVEQSKEKGKPFLILTKEGMLIKAFPKQNPDMSHSLQIHSTTYPLAKKLKWFEYTIGGLPFLLIFFGGFIGALIGGGSTMLNYHILRNDESTLTKYLKVTAVVILSVLVYLAITIEVVGLIKLLFQ